MLKVTCQRCKGIGHVEEKLKNLRTRDWDWHIIACPMCDAKGYITQADRDAYYASWGLREERGSV